MNTEVRIRKNVNQSEIGLIPSINRDSHPTFFPLSVSAVILIVADGEGREEPFDFASKVTVKRGAPFCRASAELLDFSSLCPYDGVAVEARNGNFLSASLA